MDLLYGNFPIYCSHSWRLDAGDRLLQPVDKIFQIIRQEGNTYIQGTSNVFQALLASQAKEK
jgi:hypothetical protein